MERQVRERFEGREVNPVMLEMFLLTPGGHVAALLHEAFHAFQAMYFPRRFQKALSSYKAEQHYPFEDEAFKKAWNEEGLLLGEAYTRKEDGEVKNIIRKFLEMREKRRVLAGLGADLIAYEKNLEWLEGMGKYAEMRFAELAAGEAGNEKRAKDYTIVFNRARYDMRSRLRRLGEQSGDLRFYLSGFVLARLLDRLRPGWKEVMFSDQKISFEDLLRECVAGP
jgi:hypothetical protein